MGDVFVLVAFDAVFVALNNKKIIINNDLR